MTCKLQAQKSWQQLGNSPHSVPPTRILLDLHVNFSRKISKEPTNVLKKITSVLYHLGTHIFSRTEFENESVLIIENSSLRAENWAVWPCNGI